MKTIGFLTIHDDYNFSEDLESLTTSEAVEEAREEVLAYLKGGELCVPLMGAVENDEVSEDFFGYVAVYTDGTWFWPQYLIPYLEEFSNYKINEEFIDHVKKNKRKKIQLSEEEVKKLEKQFLKETGFK